MRRYLFLFFHLAKYGLIGSLAYRFQFLAWAVLSLIWAALFIVSVELIFGQVNAIAGWTKNETLLLVSLQTFFVGCLWIFIFPNLMNFSQLVRHGEFDFYLLKPVNLRFLVSTREFQYDQFLRLIVIGFLVSKLLETLGITISFWSALGFLVVFLAGLFIFYNLFFILIITNFWFINIHNFEDFFHNILELVGYPPRFIKELWEGFLPTLSPSLLSPLFPPKCF